MQKWEYLFVFCNVLNGSWVPFNVNGAPLPNWQSGPPIQSVSSQLGEEGWELINMEAKPDFSLSVFIFKRPKV